MSYSDQSNWSDNAEIECLIALKLLIDEGFPRGRQSVFSDSISAKYELDKGSVSAKISNFKSLAGINNKSNASENSRKIYKQYSNYTVLELRKLIDK